MSDRKYKLSVIVPVLNSHEIVRRHILHYEKVGVPDDVEIIFLDDGSEPPLKFDTSLDNFYIHRTNDYRPWTWAIARNTGARRARGDWLLMIDVDFIIPRETFEFCKDCDGQRIQFIREFGVLNENGDFTQDLDVLRAYGLDEERIQVRGVKIPPHANMFAMKKELFWKLGGYREDCIGRRYPQGEDRSFKSAWMAYERTGAAENHPVRPKVYMFPNGKFCGDLDYNPFGLFHNLSRK